MSMTADGNVRVALARLLSVSNFCSVLHRLQRRGGRPNAGWSAGWSSRMNTVVEWLFGAALRRLVDYRVAARMRDFAAAMRGANMHVFFQDRELRYKAVISLQRDGVGIELIGRTDEQVLSSLERNAVVAAKKKVIATGKKKVIATGEAGDCEVSFVMPQGPAVFAMHIEPIRGSDSNIEGISCLAVDITRVRSPESERRRSSDDLKTTVQRYETALRESNVTVFTQDRDLRLYVNQQFPGRTCRRGHYRQDRRGHPDRRRPGRSDCTQAEIACHRQSAKWRGRHSIR